jgi:hypothetical protein
MENLDNQNNQKQRKQKAMWVAIISIIMSIVILVVIITWSKLDSDTDGQTFNAVKTKKELLISDVNMSVEYTEYLGYSCDITGIAKNASGENYSYACVEFSIYDVNGYSIGTALDVINYLGNGESWSFKAQLYISDTEPYSCKLVNVTVL